MFMLKKIIIFSCIIYYGSSLPFPANEKSGNFGNTTPNSNKGGQNNVQQSYYYYNDVAGFNSSYKSSSFVQLNNAGTISSYSNSAFATENKLSRRVSTTNNVIETGNLNNDYENKVNPLPLDVDGTGRSNINSVTPVDKDAIIFPDMVKSVTPKDSYGNPVTPYTILPEASQSSQNSDSEISDIGHHTDVNRDEGVLGPVVGPAKPTSTATIDNFAFVLPSYASGITKLETFADGRVPVKASNIPKPSIEQTPLSSGNFNYPEIYKETTTSTTQQTPLVNYNRVGLTNEGSIISPPSNTLLPPHIPEQSSTYKFSKNNNQQNTNLRPTTQQKSQTTTTTTTTTKPNYTQTAQNQPPNFSNQNNFQTLISSPSLSSISNVPQKPSIQLETPFETPTYQNQQLPQQPIQPKQNEQSAGALTNRFQQSQPINQQNPPQPQPPQLPLDLLPPFVSQPFDNQPQNPSQHVPINLPTTPSTVPQQPSQPPLPTKYTGGFGGAPGVLSPFDSQVIASQKPNTNNFSRVPIQGPTAPKQPTLPATTKQPARPATTKQPARPQKTEIIRVPTVEIGFNYQQNSSPSSSIQFGTQVNQLPSRISVPQETNNRSPVYKGTFGGPPGILTPYDNNSIRSAN